MSQKGIFVFIIISIGLLIISTPTLSGEYDMIAQEIQESYTNKQPRPLVSQKIKNLTIDQAHEIQTRLVKLMENKGEICMGYKAGLWGPAGQKRFGLNQPVQGTLFKSMLRWPGTIYLHNHTRLFIEPEIGFRFQKDITEPINDINVLKRAVAITYPAIELPDIAFPDMKLLKGVDLIASNVAARKVLIGNAATVEDLNAVTVKLLHNGQEIASGMGKNAGGNQWEALKWVVNDVLAKGGKIKNGDVVITGSLTKLIPAKPGKYIADYGDFGMIEFEFK